MTENQTAKIVIEEIGILRNYIFNEIKQPYTIYRKFAIFFPRH